jgi:hypothetical protein
MAWLASSAVPAAGEFLARALRFDPGAVVRLRPAGADRLVAWVRLPFGVLVSCPLHGTTPDDRTVRADALRPFAEHLPAGRDTDWRWPLPPEGRVVERLPVADVLRVSAAAATTIRTAAAEGVGGKAVGSRALRDALLDHVPFVVTTDAGERFPVSQRLVQAMVRMGFVPNDGDLSAVDVCVGGPWTGLATPYGAAWYRPPLLLR